MPFDFFSRQARSLVKRSPLWQPVVPCLIGAAIAWSCQDKDNALEPPAGPFDGGTPGARVDAGPPPPAPSDWCSARKVLEGHCTGCHVVGSPFGSIPLVTFEDLQAKLPSG